MHDAMPTGIWPHNPLLPRQGNGHTRHTLSIQSLARPQPSIGYCYPPCLHNARLQGNFPASLHQQCRNASSHSPASTASIPSRNNEVTVAHKWKFFWPSINKAIKEVVHQCETCTWFQSQNAAVSLTPPPTPSCPWQMCATYIFTLEGVDHQVVGNF